MTGNGKKYLSDVRSLLPNSRCEKRRIMARMEAQLESYLSSAPEADYDELCRQFGTPTEIATSALMAEGSERVLRDLRANRRLVTVAASFAIAVFLVIAATAGYFAYEVYETYNSHIEETSRDIRIVRDGVVVYEAD